MSEILEVAGTEFSSKGLSGARIDDIAAATRTSKRMIYYYFGSKEGLYLKVLEAAYRSVRSIEASQSLGDLAPDEALRRLVAFTFDHHLAHPNYIRLVMAENMERGVHLARSEVIQEVNANAIDAIRDLYERGIEQGLFRQGLDPVDIHSSISALCFFNVSNKYTFGLIFGKQFDDPAYVETRRSNVIEMVERFVRN